MVSTPYSVTLAMFLDTHCLCLLELGDDGATIKRSAYQESDLREDDERSVSWAERADIVSLSGTRAFDASTTRQRYDGFVSFHPYMSPDIALYIGELLHRGSGVAKRNYGS